MSLPPSLEGRSQWDSGSAPAKKLLWGVESRAGKGLAGQGELGWDKGRGISTLCAFPVEFVAWMFKAKRQMCLHTQVIYSSGLIGNPMISSTISQLFSHYSLPTCDALAGREAASPPPHSCHAVTNLTGSSPEKHSQNRSASQASPQIAPMWVPWLQQPPGALSTSRLEKPWLLLGVTHTGEWEPASPCCLCKHTADVPGGTLQPSVTQLKMCLRGFDYSV